MSLTNSHSPYRNAKMGRIYSSDPANPQESGNLNVKPGCWKNSRIVECTWFSTYNLVSRTPLYLTTYTGLCQPFPVGGEVIHDSFVRALQSQPSYQQDSQKDVGENGCEVYHLKKFEQIKLWELAFEKGGFFKESGFFFLKKGGGGIKEPVHFVSCNTCNGNWVYKHGYQWTLIFGHQKIHF